MRSSTSMRNMSSLLEVQREFAAAFLSDSSSAVARHIDGGMFTGEERLAIYRNASRSSLVAALGLTYPAVARLVGDEFFEGVARRFAIARAPAGGYLNEYGGGFGDYLSTFPGATTIPYLADVARFEWALGQAANAEDRAPLAPAALASVAAPAGLRFMPHVSLRMLWLRHPADQIADAVLSGDETAMRDVDPGIGPARIVVHRGPDGVEAQRLDASDYVLLSALFAGEPWERLVERAPERAAPLLAEQLVKGRLGGFRNDDSPKDPK